MKGWIKVLRVRWSIFKLNRSSKRLAMEKSLTRYIKSHEEVNILNYFVYRLVWKMRYNYILIYPK